VVVEILEELGDCFETKPDGISMHYAHKNGLLEHTVHAVRAG